MWDRHLDIQIKALFWITIINFLAQIPYYFHLYYRNTSDLIRMVNLPMLLVLALFLIAYILLIKEKRLGYWLMLLFLAIEFIFYLSNVIYSCLLGFGPFFQLYNPNLILKLVFAIGYVNLFASGYFLFLLIFKKEAFMK